MNLNKEREKSEKCYNMSVVDCAARRNQNLWIILVILISKRETVALLYTLILLS